MLGEVQEAKEKLSKLEEKAKKQVSVVVTRSTAEKERLNFVTSNKQHVLAHCAFLSDDALGPGLSWDFQFLTVVMVSKSMR